MSGAEISAPLFIPPSSIACSSPDSLATGFNRFARMHQVVILVGHAEAVTGLVDPASRHIVKGDQGIEVVLLGLLFEQRLQLRELLGVFLGEVQTLGIILVEVV